MALGAVSFGMAGAAFDQITVTLSPEYFLLGKHVAPGGSLRWSAALVGFNGGLSIGALTLGVFSWFRARGRKVRLGSLIALSALAVLPASAVAALFLLTFDPFGVRAESLGIMGRGAASRYLLAWSLHIGAYVGPAVCLAINAVRTARRAA